MGARAARLVDWTARASRIALVASAGALVVGFATDFGFAVPLEVAIRRDLSALATTDALTARANAALDVDDVGLARGIADLGVELGRPLPQATRDRLAAAEAPGAVAWRTTKGLAHGFVTGEMDGPAAMAGALAADLTLIGDIRDLATEGAKAARGEEPSRLVMGLAAAGVAVTAATYATGGAGAPARVGFSILKAAARTGAMTAEFAADLVRRFAKSGERAALRSERSAVAVGAPAANAAAGGVIAAAGDLAAVERTVGGAETVRLLRYVRSVDETQDLRRFTTRFGVRSRAVAAFTGRASLRAFRTTLRFGELLLKELTALLMWFGGLAAGAVSTLGRRAARSIAVRI